MKVLIAEDDRTARFLLERILNKEGHEVLSANNGEEALKLYHENEITMCVTDWMMPKLDGVELCKKIRDAEADSDNYCYVIILTAKSQREDLISALEAGADDYISKPYEIGELMARLFAGKRILDLKSQLLETKEEALLYSSIMAHDLQNFNFGAMGYIEMSLMGSNLTGDQKKNLQTAYDFVKKNSDLIANIRKIMKSRHSEFQFEDMDLADIFENVTGEMRNVYNDRNVKIRSEIHPNDFIVRVDEFVKDLFQNLLTNAVKYDEHDDVVIELEVGNGSSAPDGFYNVRVKDHGCGIPDDTKGRIFKRFERNNKEKGTGLGLTIVKSIADRYGGAIWIEDREPGDHTKGSVFNVTLPRAN